MPKPDLSQNPELHLGNKPTSRSSISSPNSMIGSGRSLRQEQSMQRFTRTSSIPNRGTPPNAIFDLLTHSTFAGSHNLPSIPGPGITTSVTTFPSKTSFRRGSSLKSICGADPVHLIGAQPTNTFSQ